MTFVELRVLAEAADSGVGSWPNAGWFSVLGHTKKDATYIATIRPDLILAILDERARWERALISIRDINDGPDKASGEWRCMEAAAIARQALAEKMERLP